MTKLSQILKGNKTDNHPENLADKINLRRLVTNEVGQKICVFDAFAGTGVLYRKAWKDFDYVGCDKKWYRDERMTYVSDNRRVLRCIDLQRFNVFDLDSYGSPWEQAIIIAARRQVKAKERIGLLLTEGSGLTLKFGGVPNALALLAGSSNRIIGAIRWHQELLDRALLNLAARMKCRIVKRWQANREKQSAMIYVAVVFEGQ